MNTKIVAVVAIGIMALTGCTSPNSEVPDTWHAQASYYLPGTELEDWAGYADQLSVIEVVGEDQQPLDPSVAERGEGRVSRKITVEIEQTLWTRPGTIRAPEQIVITTIGWALRDGNLVPMSYIGAERMEVGARYLVPLTRFKDARDDGGYEWGAMNDNVILKLDGNLVVRSESLDEASRPESVKGLLGRPTEDVANLLAGAQPHPLVLKYASLPPKERYDAVIEERLRTETNPEDIQGN